MLSFIFLLQSAEKTNVIIVMTDDQGIGDFGFMGNEVIRTPELDAIAVESIRMEHFYVSPVCSPTRASLMTGRYNYRTGVVDTFLGRSMMSPSEYTLAELFQDNGYDTGIFGKWHLGDNYPMRPMDQGFQENLIHLGGGIGQSTDKFGHEGQYTNPWLYHNGVEKQYKGYCTDIFFDASISWMKSRNKPFFAFISLNAPHGPFRDVPNKLYKSYKKVDFSSIKTYKNSHDDDKLARIAAMITNVDENIGKLDLFLKANNLTENTILIFLTDNGANTFRYAAGFKGKKTQVSSGGVRTVFLIRWSQLKPGVCSSGFGAHIDIMPTLAAVCNLEINSSRQFDGINLMTQLQGGRMPDRSLILQTHRGDSPEAERHFTIVTKDWKLNHASGFGKVCKAPWELYYQDFYEKENVIATYPEVFSKMRAEYNDWFKEMKDSIPAITPIHIGSIYEKTSLLSRQDWRLTKGRASSKRSSGYWDIKTEGGKYSVLIHTEASAKLIKGTIIYQNDILKEFTLAAGETSVQFEGLKLPATEGRFEVRLDYDDHVRGAYQVILEKD